MSLPPHGRPSPAPRRICTPVPRPGRAPGEPALALRGHHQGAAANWGLSRGAPRLPRTSQTHGLPSAPQHCPGLKLKLPTIRLIFFPLSRAALLQAHCRYGALRSAPAPRPRQLPRPRAAWRSAAPEPSVGPGRHLRAPRGSGRRRLLPLRFRNPLLLPPPRPRSPRVRTATPATYHNCKALPVPFCL